MENINNASDLMSCFAAEYFRIDEYAHTCDAKLANWTDSRYRQPMGKYPLKINKVEILAKWRLIEIKLDAYSHVDRI